MYASIGSEGIFYSSDTKILNVEILDPISRMPADTGSVFPINDRDIYMCFGNLKLLKMI